MKKRTTAIILGTLFLLTLVFLNPTSSFGSETPPWYNYGWAYRKSHTINAACGAGTNYQVKIYVHYGSGTDYNDNTKTPPEGHVYCNTKCKTDFGDIRFTDNDGTTLLDYWMEKYSNPTIFWVEVKDDLSTNAQTIYIYYGNDNATTTSNGDNTFLSFDHFLGSSIDTNKWDITDPDKFSVANSWVTCIGDTTTCPRLDSVNNIKGVNVAVECRIDVVALGNTGYAGFRVVWISPGDGFYWYKEGNWDRYIRFNGVGSWKPGTNKGMTTGKVRGMYYKTSGKLRWKTSGTRNFDDSWTGTTVDTDRTLRIFVTTSYYTVKLDWIIIRNYVDPEPSHGAWGSEEEQADEATVVFRSTGGLGWFAGHGWPDEGYVSYEVSVYISELFDIPPYDYTYYANGPAVTRNNILGHIEDCNDNYDYATFFIFANGVNYTEYDAILYGYPPIVWELIPVTHYLLYDTSDNLIMDKEIGEITSEGSTLYFVFLWTCVQGNEIGSFHNSYWIDYPDIYYMGSGAAGMPYAWTHRNYTQMNSDGYASPDNGAYCFIGFWGFGMPMSEEIPGSGGKNYGDFVMKFYDYAIDNGFSINDALDAASEDVCGVPFGNTDLYTGYEHDLGELGNWTGKMRVYGNGNNYLPH